LTVIVLENAKPGLRGRLTRWMLEVRAGVFVGTLSQRVRDLLWQRICGSHRGGALLIHRARTEQGFLVHSHGDPSRAIFDIEGLQLVQLR
jgi:CRISPR-associated protein Cas2